MDRPSVSRVSVTSLSQYVRLENCERFLRFRLRPEEARALLDRWSLTIQPLTPLLRDEGAAFEREVETQIAARGEPVLNLQDKKLEATRQALREAHKPTILLQPEVEGILGRRLFHGRADVLRVSRNKEGALDILVADIKASRHERTEHRLQIAVYAHAVRAMAQAEGLSVGRLAGTVMHIQPGGELPPLDLDAPSFELETYFHLLEHLAAAPEGVIERVASLPFDQVPYHLGYKCDGCLYNALCMFDSAERLDLALVPEITAVEKRVLRGAGITRLPELANLMQLPNRERQEKELRVTPGQEGLYARLVNEWPVGPNLPLLVQRARRALARQDRSVESSSILYGRYSTLPSDEDHPTLVKVFFDAQHDYIQDRVYLISAILRGPQGEREIVRAAPAPPTEESERDLLVGWVREVLQAITEVAGKPEAALHLYCYNRYDQQVLLQALKRHLSQVAALPAVFDLLTQTPALDQTIISFLADELRERRNLGLVCSPLHDAARTLGFNWADGQFEFYSLFRARLFDNRRDVLRAPGGSLVPAGREIPKDDPRRITIEAASRFNSQIPLEYAYGAWGALPRDFEEDALLAPFRSVTPEALQAFALHRARALAHIESRFKVKARGMDKPALHLPSLAQGAVEPNLERSLHEFLFMEHHAALQAKLLGYHLPIERRAQTGLALLLRYDGAQSGGSAYRFAIDFSAMGLDPVLAMNAFRLREGDWVVVNPADPPPAPGQIKNGRLATLRGVGPDWVALDFKEMSGRTRFRYFHNVKLAPQPGKRYTLDEMADDLNADKELEALQHTDDNVLYRALLAPPSLRSVPADVRRDFDRLADLVNTLERSDALTGPQRSVVVERLSEPMFLVQGPPGTGKSHTLAWAVLARMAVSLAEGRPFRVAVACKTHNAVQIVLAAISNKWHKLRQFPTPLTRGLVRLKIYKLGGDNNIEPPAGIKPLDYYAQRGELEPILQQPALIVGGTPGGLYSLARYRAAGGRSVDWRLKPFDLVVIDEASQMSLPEGILASAFLKPEGTEIVVGDHRQMPPIIAHAWEDEPRRMAGAHRPYLSLFEALRERGLPWVGLDESFRLHASIAEFLRRNIYSRDDIPFFSRRHAVLTPPPSADPFVCAALDPQYPVVVIEHGEHASQQYNRTEIELVAPLIEACARGLSLDGRDGIGVVVPHRAQRALLRERFPDLAIADSIDTVERFQGGERDVIIVSATASDPDYVLAEAEFLLNLNRLNVALSRPRKKLIVVASQSVLHLLTSDLGVFENALLWKRLYEWTTEALWEGDRAGHSVRVRGRKA